MATYNPLSTNFKDDILADSNDRRKYTQINNSDGTISLQDSTAYKQVGSQYGAKEVNEEREAINNIYANKLVSLDEIDLVTEEGYFVDAKAVKELNSNFKVYTKSITSKPWASINSDNYETRKYRRIGNLVMLEYLANFNTDGTLSFNLIEQSIPQGYRPVTTVYLPFVQTSGANVIGHGRLRLSPDGTSYMSLTEPGYTEHGGTMMYFTNDPFPKD